MWKFVKQFILHPRNTGSIVPSSPDLARAMLAPVDFSKANNIVELGPGTGAFTRLILTRMKKDAQLTVLELNEEFCRGLEKIEDSRMKVIHGNAMELSSHVKNADYVISGLPLNSFSKKEHLAVLKEIKKIVKHAYIQFHYAPLREELLKENFPRISKKLVVKNIPPAIVYTARQ